MGDRVNVKVIDSGSAVYLYSHWGGSELPADVQKALAKRWRWDDGAYLTRIIFDVMTEGRQGEETGFGISTRICDNEHPIVAVSSDSKCLWLENEDGSKIDGTKKTFTEFIALNDAALEMWFSVDFEREPA